MSPSSREQRDLIEALQADVKELRDRETAWAEEDQAGAVTIWHREKSG